MALYVKQDFSPPVLSRKWVLMKFRPNMLLYSRQHILSILESGLLFREDSIEVEQESPGAAEVWLAAGGGASGWLTRGERLASVVAVSLCVAMFPPRAMNRSALAYVAAYAALPLALRAAHRRAGGGALAALLRAMRGYLQLARRAAACLRECAALRAQLGSVSSVIESTRTMLCRQQSELAVTMSRASSALLGNAPWLRSDVAWDAVDRGDDDNLIKIHHAFLVVQSTLLKHIAMAHYIPSIHAQKLYRNLNERIYWIHNTLIRHLTDEFTENYEALERMYRLLKNYGNADQSVTKKPGSAINDTWTYSDVHSDVARANLELKLALNKCNNLDAFLDSCALHKQEIDLEMLNKDIDNLIGHITKSLSTAQSSQLRLKKLLMKFGPKEAQTLTEVLIENDKNILKIEDREPEARDEVFYFVKTEDDEDRVQPSGDISTGPGKKEKETTKIVLNELRRKLVGREDVMRERERQALAKTMPELKDKVPEFPRQIKIEEYLERKGYITKIPKKTSKRRLFKKYKIQSPKPSTCSLKNNYKLNKKKFDNESDIKSPSYEANSILNAKSKIITFCKNKNDTFITEWHKNSSKQDTLEFSDLSDGLSDVEGGAVNKNINQSINESILKNNTKQNGDARNFTFTKKDLELSPSSTDSESDFELYKERQIALLKDVRKHRAARRKNFPDKRVKPQERPEVVDEGLRPVEYSFGAGLAMASVLQVNSSARFPNLAQEEVFIGDGEVSEDSGNDEDA
ncbi:uncharacterized protein LOC126378836 isoform X2 [Pectinophora gossypiella]|uniref:uncharacterized protein LOC126378836 isoform X2 n=1 Tax=Pectinophora gossypiella TaxID=13191 RepID=UPI00214EC4B0|nr:uncharacterized protein LOC126378836 isoform X2 [Pectinophora gossypiella]